MKDSRMEGLVVDLAHRESGGFLKHLVDVHDRAISRQDRDGLANGIGDGAKVRRLLAELLLDGRSLQPARRRRRGDREPTIGPVKTPKTFFRCASLFRLPDVLPPGFELWDIVRMDNRFPLPSRQLFRTKPGVISKSFVDEIQGAIRQSGPGNRQNSVNESAEFQSSRALSLTHTHRVHPASQQALTARRPPSQILRLPRSNRTL